MTATALHPTGAEESRPLLLAEIERIRALLRAGSAEPVDGPTPAHDIGPLDALARRLGLSAFERDVLMLAAAVELDGGVAGLVAEQQGGDARPTFALAMAVLPEPHWDALVPHRPLRRWALVRIDGTAALASRPLSIDEHVLHAIAGLADRDAPGGLWAPRPREVPLTPTQREVAEELALGVRAAAEPVLVRLDGDDPDARVGVAQHLAAQLGRGVLAPPTEHHPHDGDLVRQATVLDRECLVGDCLPVVTDPRLVPLLVAPVVVQLGDDPAPRTARPVLARTVSRPEPPEQRELWREALPADAPSAVLATADDLAQHYRLSARAVRAVAAEWVLRDADADDLRRLTRDRARVGLGLLAERVEPRSGWEDLVLPEGQLGLLHDIARQVRHRATVYEEWGFGATSTRGLGVTALFAGESGTGKTMAAEVLADDLALDLYRIDLSAVVSKYIGETEKNLRSVFDAAEESGAVLLFDEADALFGRRSDVKDSHDRYANIEVAYLLQRMEAYRGLAVLTTNLRGNVDRAFVRRLRFVVQFPFPDETLREQIWRRAFPPATPTEGLDPRGLARMQVSGGSIRSIALSAAFAAADAGTPVRPEHVLRAAKADYAKAERTLTDAESRGIGVTR